MKIQGRTLKFAITLILMCLFLIFLHYVRVLQPVEHLFSNIFSPVQKSLYGVSSSINNWYNLRDKKEDLRNENEELKKIISETVVNESIINDLEKENQDLKNLLSIKDSINQELVVGNIIGKTVDGVQNTLLLNIGSNEGISIGDPVVVDEKIIIGKIINTTPKTSVILLLTDQSSKVAATIQNKDITIGIVEGEHNINMKMRLIPQDELVYEGNTVVTSGLEESVPKGLVVGTVNHLVTQSGDVFQTAIIKPIIDYNKLFVAGVLKGKVGE